MKVVLHLLMGRKFASKLGLVLSPLPDRTQGTVLVDYASDATKVAAVFDLVNVQFKNSLATIVFPRKMFGCHLWCAGGLEVPPGCKGWRCFFFHTRARIHTSTIAALRHTRDASVLLDIRYLHFTSAALE